MFGPFSGRQIMTWRARCPWLVCSPRMWSSCLVFAPWLKGHLDKDERSETYQVRLGWIILFFTLQHCTNRWIWPSVICFMQAVGPFHGGFSFNNSLPRNEQESVIPLAELHSTEQGSAAVGLSSRLQRPAEAKLQHPGKLWSYRSGKCLPEV